MIQEAPTAARINPFPGLRPFEPAEDYLFFGREKQVDEVLRRLRSTRFLAILGTSGSGKSSLVRSGLIPSLYGGAMTRAGSSWRVAILRPGHDPLGNLAAALTSPEALGTDGEGGDDLTQAFVETTLRASKLGLVECVLQARIPQRDNVLVLVDQFEELFRFKQSGKEGRYEEAVAFVNLLVEASRYREAPIYVVLTMRSDFFERCMDFAELSEVINEGLYLVPRMSRDELRAAITGPVAVGGAEISPRLVARLLNDVGDNPDQLPILQHALMRTWERWEGDHAPGEPLDLRHYETIGTMGQALSQHAEEALQELDAEGQRIAEALFRALTDKGTDRRGIRRPATLSDICELTGADEDAVTAVIDRFRLPGRSFLMPPLGAPLRSDSYLDISHESLMRIWKRLRAWVDDEAQSAQIYRGVAQAAARHEEGVAALWRDPELQVALTWRQTAKPTQAWARRYDPGFDRAMRFLDASEEARQKETAEREERRRSEQRQKLWRRVVWVLAAAALLTLGFAAFAVVQRNQANAARAAAEQAGSEAGKQRDAAQRERREALLQKRKAELRRREALRLKTLADQQKSKAEKNSLLAEEQKRIADEERAKAQDEKLKAIEASKEADQRRSEALEEKAKADKARGDAETNAQENLRLNHLALARSVALQTLRLPGNKEEEKELSALLALAAYHLHVKSGGNSEEADLFNALRVALDRLRPQPAWTDHQDAVRALAVDPQGTAFFSGSEDGKVRRFDLRPDESLPDKSPGAVLTTFRKGVRAIAVDAKGDHLAAGSADGSLKILDLHTSTAPARELTGPGSPVVALAFQQGESLLAVGRADGEVSLWAPGAPSGTPLLYSGHGKSVTSLAFNQDGTLLTAGLAQGGALLWDLQRISSPPAAFCLKADVRSVAFQPHNVYLACGTASGDILLETFPYRHRATPKYRRWLHGHRSSVNALAFRADLSLASGSADHTVRLWDLTRSDTEPEAVGRDDKDPEDFDTEPIVLTGHSSWVWSVAFLPGGDRLLSGGADRTVRRWEGRSKNLIDELCLLVSRPLEREEWTRFFGDEDFPDEGEVCSK